MSMNHGRPAKTPLGWLFGTSIQGQFYPLGFCRDCGGHATAEEAVAHYKWFLDTKHREVVADIRRGEAEALPAPASVLQQPLASLRAVDGQLDRRMCLDCGTVYAVRTDLSASIQLARCDVCQERVAAAADEEIADQRLRKYAAMRDTLWIGCGVQDNYRDATLATFSTTNVTPSIKRAHAIASRWAAGFDIANAAGRRGLILHGTVGTGKTHLAAALLRAVTDKLVPTREDVLRFLREERAAVLSSTGYDDTVGTQRFYRTHRFPIERFSVRFTVAPELVDQLVDARFHQAGKDSEEDIYTRLNSTRLLVIDDLGRVTRPSQTETQQTIWYRIFNARYNHRLPMIVTTNKTVEELNAIVGEAVADRMVEMFDFVDMTGQSYRRQKRG